MNFKQFPKPVIKENVQYTNKEITNVIKKYGPRAAVSDNCYSTQKHIKKEMAQFCDETEFESYTASPKAYGHFTKWVSFLSVLIIAVCAVLAFAGILEFWIAQCIVGVVMLLGFVGGVMDLCFKKPLAGSLYKKSEGHNFYAIQKPFGDVKKRVIIVANVDAPYKRRFVSGGKTKGASPIVSTSLVFVFLSLVIAFLTVAAQFVSMGSLGEMLISYGYFFHFLTALFLCLLFWHIDYKTVFSGANDNLTGAYTAVSVPRMLDMAGAQFEHTEVCCVITDGKNAAGSGAKHWAKQHCNDSNAETIVICVDSLANVKSLGANANGLSNDFMKSVFDDAGYDYQIKSKSNGMLTDAAPFIDAKIPTVCFIADDIGSGDEAADLSNEAIEAGFALVLSAVCKFDEKGLF